MTKTLATDGEICFKGGVLIHAGPRASFSRARNYRRPRFALAHDVAR